MFLAPEAAEKGLEASRQELEQAKALVLFNLNQAFSSVILFKKILEVNEESYKLSEENVKLADSRLKAGAGSSFDSLRARVRGSNIKPLVAKSRNNYELALQNLKNLLGLPLSLDIRIEGGFNDVEGAEFKAEAFESALKKALRDRVELKKANARKAMAEVSLALISASDKPLLTGNISYNYQNPYYSQPAWVESWNAGVILSIPVFDGFSTAGKVKQAETTVKSADIAKNQIENMIELEVKQAVLNINEANERILSQFDSVKQAEEYYRIAETSYSSGVNTNYDVMDAHLSLLAARTAYLQALYDLTVAKAAFLKATGELK
ncbi:MAG: TolC family protein [Candidatus Firestonebacteria bacterium]